MRAIVITQKDRFFIPKNIEMLILSSSVEIISIYLVNSTGSLTNKKMMFVKGFGFFQSLKMFLKIISNELLNLLDSITFYKVFDKRKSLSSLSKKYRVKLNLINNPNDIDVINKIKSDLPEIIISFSAPVVFKKSILEIPKYGCINLHCSLLPNYSGLLPSFWTLYYDEDYTGSTVHYMDSKIDNGLILNQEKIKIDKNSSMFDIIKKTKRVGGKLMLKSIIDLKEDMVKVRENKVDEHSYRGWPSIEEIIDFKNRGGRLIWKNLQF